MADSNNNSNDALRRDVERTQLQTESIRLQLEQLKTFLEHWRTEIEPLHESRIKSREFAFQFSKFTLQSIFLLNGCALIAFPTFAGLIGTGFQHQLTWALVSIAFFVLGLILVAASSLFAFFSMNADSDAIHQRSESVKAQLNEQRVAQENKQTFQNVSWSALELSDGAMKLAYKLRAWAIGLGIGSISAFIVGVVFAGLVLAGSATTQTT